MPSRGVCQRVRRGERAQKKLAAGSESLTPNPSAHAIRQRRLTAWPPADPFSPHVQARPRPPPPSLPDGRAAALAVGCGAVPALLPPLAQVLSDQRWAGRGGDTAVVQGAASSSQVRPPVEPRLCVALVSARARAGRDRNISGHEAPQDARSTYIPGGLVTTTVVEERRRVGAARWRRDHAGAVPTRCAASTNIMTDAQGMHRSIVEE